MELSKPLTLEEVQEATDIFLPLYELVRQRLCGVHQNPSVEDTLKVMENICKLAQQQRAQTKLDRFGFNKGEEDGDVPSS